MLSIFEILTKMPTKTILIVLVKIPTKSIFIMVIKERELAGTCM